MTPYSSPSRDTRDDQRRRNAVAERLRTAVELEQAAQVLREAGAVHRHTLADKARLNHAETCWDLLKVRDWQVTS